MDRPGEATVARLTGLLGAVPTGFSAVSGGYTPAERWRFEAGGRRYFVKIGATDYTSAELRREFHAYAGLRGDFLPQLIATQDDPERPLMILEDLSDWHWPPPWTVAQIDAVLRGLEALHATRAEVPPIAETGRFEPLGWQMVAADCGPFLRLGLVSRDWLDHALPDLLAAESACVLEGDAVCHWDLRSDNICLRDNRVKFVDWNGACLSNGRVDLGGWLPSLEMEGGPQPEAILGHAPEIAAWMAGYFAGRAGLADVPGAPRVRWVQRAQLRPALRWAVRALELPPLAE